MPKKMLWTERLFSYFPINKKKFGQQMLARFFLLFSVWLSGLLAHALDGQIRSYISNLSIYQWIFLTSFVTLFGTYMFQRYLSDLIPKVRPMVTLDDAQFRKFSARIERYSYSILPCLVLALGFVVFLSDAPSQFQQALVEGFKLHVIWNLVYTFFLHLLSATGIWMLVSIWMVVFLVSRQPLNLELSPKIIEGFRDLSVWALWSSLFYFVAVSILVVIYYAGGPSVESLLEIFLSPYLFFVAIGVIGVFFPFYNIHMALLKMKKQELSRIQGESERLMLQLDEVLAIQPASQFNDLKIDIMTRLFRLQIKESQVKAAPEWPVSMSFLSKLAGLVVMPIIGRILAEVLKIFFP